MSTALNISDLRDQARRRLPRMVFDMALHPRWWVAMLRHGQPDMAHLRSADTCNAALQAALLQRQMDAGFDWQRLRQMRERWPHQLVIKGLLHPQDVLQAFALGADAVVVSNHGGRQLDGAPASLECLAEAVEAAAGRPVLLDGGIRRGSDVLKALALGAAAVLLGRAPMYGLAAGGEQGVATALSLLATEFDTAMALTGCSSLRDLQRDQLRYMPHAPSR